MIIQQNRGAQYMPHDNAIHDNDITMAGGGGAVAGWFADYKGNKFANTNLFASNRYHVGPNGADKKAWAANSFKNFSQWQATGQDTGSTVDTNTN